QLVPNLNIIIVSDHGMNNIDEEKKELIFKNSETELIKDEYRVYGQGPLVQFYKKDMKNFKRDIKLDIESMNKDAKNYKCYSNSNTPAKLNFNTNPRVGDIVC